MDTKAQIANPVFPVADDTPVPPAIRPARGMKGIVAPLVLLALFLAAWQYLPPALGISRNILPRFSEVAAVFGDVGTLQLYAKHAWVTLKEAGYGLLIGGSLGFVSGLVLTESKLLMRSFYPYIVALQCMPKVALAPLLVIWFGFGITSKVIVVALLCFFPVLVNTISGIRSVSSEQLELFAAIRAPRLKTHLHLLIPAALPSIMTGIELAVVVSLLGAIVGEFVGAEEGLGVMLLQAQFQMAMPSVFALLLVLALMGVVFNLAIRTIRRKALYWIAGESGK
jgi:NitT/TauT family transport system permease protein